MNRLIEAVCAGGICLFFIACSSTVEEIRPTALTIPIILSGGSVPADYEAIQGTVAKRVAEVSRFALYDANATDTKGIYLDVRVKKGPRPYAVAGIDVYYKSYDPAKSATMLHGHYSLTYSSCHDGRGMYLNMYKLDSDLQTVKDQIPEVVPSLAQKPDNESGYPKLSSLSQSLIDSVKNRDESSFSDSEIVNIVLDARYLHDPYTVLRDRRASP